MLRKLAAARPDVVMNSTDAIGDDRTKVAHIAAFLELAGYPYTGSGPFALALTTDKSRSKQLLAAHGVPVPAFFTVAPGARPPRDVTLPRFVKPVFGGAKECVSLESAVRSRAALEQRIRFVHRVARQPALCEEFIEGRELTVGVLETASGLRVFPVREMVFGGSNGTGPRFATHRVMEDVQYRRRWNVTMRNARLSAAQDDAIRRSARVAFRALDLHGYGRLDLRLGTDGVAYVLEVNANPALRPRTHSFIAPWPGIAYEELIAQVISTAHTRSRASTPMEEKETHHGHIE
jgi:D-alanine-D-alanine ligase